ncbi:hypothetical protein GUJ93_ZPchr0012g21236 [Zizania palustris]|uniref:Uncharacterized protein n=1 Tax=Zizania palustris TaxID=103762 RepID=A0A8J5WWL8_ZIZPA|nr:hypothetical protein GUJ93_ZPchr0012g21236 [Zizania palustris]
MATQLQLWGKGKPASTLTLTLCVSPAELQVGRLRALLKSSKAGTRWRATQREGWEDEIVGVSQRASEARQQDARHKRHAAQRCSSKYRYGAAVSNQELSRRRRAK